MKQKIRILLIFGILLAFVAIPTSAQQGVGSTAYAARLLSSGLNVGSLSPGESFWYSYSQSDFGGDMQSIILEMVFKPGDSRTARQVTFDVYTFAQVNAFLESGEPRGKKTGSGQLVDADFDPNTAERLWSGAVDAGETYYVRLYNATDLTADYHLVALPQKNAVPTADGSGVNVSVRNRTKPNAAPTFDPANPDSKWLLTAQALQGLSAEEAATWLKNAAAMGWFGEATGKPLAAAAVPVEPTPAAVESAAVPQNPVGESIYPNNPLTLLPRNVNRLLPHAEHWYSFIKDDLDGNAFEKMALTLFTTPGNGNITDRVNFELFTGDQYGVWLRGTPDEMRNTGAGAVVSRDGDPNTGEHVWRGVIIDGDRYFIRVRNDSDETVDYYLLEGDVPNTELGDSPNGIVQTSVLPAQRVQDVAVPDTVAPGTDIAHPKTMALGHNKGFLKANDDVWMSFRFQNFEQKEPERRHYTIYLKISPGVGYVANDVNVELYTQPQLNLWLRGTGDEMTPMGVGSRQTYDEKSNTQLFTWDGYLMSDTTYFVRVRNGSTENIFFDLDMEWR